MNTNNLSNTMVIFGGTGDLTHRKLLPALYNLQYENILPDHFAVVSIGRRNKTTEDYRKEIYQSIKKFSRFDLKEEAWNKLEKKIYYYQMDFTNDNTYCDLSTYLDTIDHKHHTNGNRIYYLAVAPQFFGDIVDNLNTQCIKDETDAWHRVVIEKPFGRDLESATYLNKKIVDAFKEENTYRIDHYLGKEMLQNILVIRFANMLFEPLWNNQYIEQVQISSSETLGVETRGDYYEHSGAIRDMIQSHMLQLLSLIAMEKPNDLNAESIRDEKVKVLKALKQYKIDEVDQYVVRGQYGEGKDMVSYREEKRVSPTSDTETFVALKAEVNNKRWKGVPFYIRSGKRMPKKSTEIVIQFKQNHDSIYTNENLPANLLVIRVQPMEGVFFQFNAKEPGTHQKINPVQMDFCQNCQVGINSPEAYERLLYDCMRGDATLFARWDEVLTSWEFVDTILEAWKLKKPNFPNYEALTWGPVKADELLSRDGKKWIDV